MVRDSVRARRSDPFTTLVLLKLDSYLFKIADRRAQHEMLKEAYEVARDHVMRGGHLPEAAVAEISAPTSPKRVRCASQKAARHISEIESLLRIDASDCAASAREKARPS